MFETSVVHAQPVRSRGRVGLLTASIVAHSAVVLGVVAVSIASVEFPPMAPDEYAVVELLPQVQIPPPLGDPNGGAKPQPKPADAPKPAPVQSNEVTVPPVIPDDVPVADPSSGAGEVSDSGPVTGTVEGDIGVPWGTKNSIGDLDAPPSPVIAAEPVPDKVYQPHEVKAPVLLHRVEPRYPQVLIRTGMSATVVVRCIIDKNGQVQNPQVIVPASMPPFNAEVLRVVTQWRFTPGSMRGQAVDSYFDLTVRFAVKR